MKKQTLQGNKYAVMALKHKRATLAGEIARMEVSLEWKRQQLIHVDATLALFGQSDPDAIPNVKPYKRIMLFKQGELAQAVRDALRRAGKPLLLSEVVEGVREGTGLDESAIPALRQRVRASLQYLWGTHKAVTKAGRGTRVTWALSDRAM